MYINIQNVVRIQFCVGLPMIILIILDAVLNVCSKSVRLFSTEHYIIWLHNLASLSGFSKNNFLQWRASFLRMFFC
jgi:hypothetical protein